MKRAVLVWLCLLGGAGAARALTADEQMRFADGIYLRGFYETAVTEYLALLRDHPDGEHAPAALYRTGECYRQMGNPTGAERFYKQLAAQHPESDQMPRAELRRAELAIAADRFDEAAAILNGLLVGEPAADVAAAASYYLGYSRLKAGDEKGASAAYGRMLAEHPQSPYAAYAALDLAALHAPDKGNDDEMEGWFEQALAAAATPAAKAEVLFRWGDWAYRRERYAQAADLLQQLLVEFPDGRRARDARLATAWSLYYLERPAEALALAERLEQEAADAATAASGVYLQANCLRQMNRDGEALAKYETVARDYAQTSFAEGAAYEIMVTRFKRGEFAQALVAAPAQPDARHAADVLWMRAESERELGRLDAARGRYEELGRDFPKSPQAAPALLRLGEMARVAGRLDEAATWFRRVAEDYPKNEAVGEALQASALARLRAGDAKGALADWDALLERKLDAEAAAEARLQKALTLIELKKTKDALATLEEVAQGGQAARAHYWRGVLLADGEKWADAERALRASLAAAPDAQTAALARLRLAVTLQRLDRMDEAVDQIDPLLDQAELVADNPALVEWAVRRRFDQGDYERTARAAVALAKNAREPSWRQIGWHWAGASQAQLGNEKDAIAAYEKAVAEKAQTREGAESQLLLAGMDLQGGRAASAAERYAAAAAAAAGDDALDLRARAYFGLGESAEALGEADKAARHFLSVAVLFDDPEWTPHSLFRAGKLYDRLGKPGERDSAWRELRERYPASSFARQVEAPAP
ncbi:MAG: tetratricopeptide repeat protein [Spartobacteria bacterium]|nr:tetratricopeptide repeat protein [Spartobacteria bacterium]